MAGGGLSMAYLIFYLRGRGIYERGLNRAFMVAKLKFPVCKCSILHT